MPHEIIHKVKTGKLQKFNICKKSNPADKNIKDKEANNILVWYSQ